MPDLNKIKSLLLKMQRSYAHERFVLIGQFQDFIWDENFSENEELNSILTNLAGDLNFYEPLEKDREESLGYYGDEKFDLLIDTAIKKIDDFTAQ